MQTFNFCYSYFSKKLLLLLSIITIIFIFFYTFDFLFGNSHFIDAQISIREIKPIEKKIFNIEQSLGKAEDKDTSMVYEVNPVVGKFSQRITPFNLQDNLPATYELDPISKNIQHIFYPDYVIPETYLQSFNQTSLSNIYMLSYSRGYVSSSFSTYDLSKDILSVESHNGNKQKQYTNYMIEPKLSLARPGTNNTNILSTSNHTEVIITK